MIDLIQALIPAVAKEGIEILKENKKASWLRVAFQEKLENEMRFNREILREITKLIKSDGYSHEDVEPLVNLLDSNCYDSLNSAHLPLSWFYTEKADSAKVTKHLNTNKKFANYAKGLDTQSKILARIYHRTKIMKAFLGTNSVKKHSESARYIAWLISLFFSTIE